MTENAFLKQKNQENLSNTLKTSTERLFTLYSYIDYGFRLYPCFLSRAFMISPTENDENALKTREELLHFIQTHPHQAEIFAIRPKQAGFICIDIDRKNGKDGIKDFLQILKKNNIVDNRFLNIENGSFPVYVTTPNNGIHLYFKAWENFEDIKLKNICDSVEVKYKNVSLNAAGSRKNEGTMDYILHGNLSKAPLFPYSLLSLCHQNPKKEEVIFQNQTQLNNKTKNWNSTFEGCVEKARELHSNSKAHDFLVWLVCYSKKAEISESEVRSKIFTLQEHINRKDTKDTESIIKSYYK